MIDKVKKNLLEKIQIKESETILLGLSGGPDSVCLFHILRQLRSELGIQFVCAHINHMYRGKSANEDEQFVKDLCATYQIKCYIERKHATQYAKEQGLSEEEAGRSIRYGFFNRILGKLGGGYIATAHHYNDQVETVIQRIIRGTGLKGLGGMDFKSGQVIRPLLDVKRFEIEAYLNENQYEFCEDPTNMETIYGRNKVRLELLPHLEKHYNPKISESLYRLSQIAKQDNDIMDDYTKQIFQRIGKRDKDGIRLKIDDFNELKTGMKHRLIRHGIELVKGETIDIGYTHIDPFIQMCRAMQSGKKKELPRDIMLEIEYEWIRIHQTKDAVKEYTYNINKVGKTDLLEIGLSVICKKVPCQKEIKSSNIIYVDYDKIKGNLIIRNRRSGDKFVPLGMKGTKKLKDFFIDEKIPRSQREEIPILTDEQQILWVFPYRMDERYKIDRKTNEILMIEIKEA
jgi:tRNA(Ile)-lysidine synthase